MATSVFFNGLRIVTPGSYTRVDASGLERVGLGASGIVACLGEAEGGEPDVVVASTNPGAMARRFRDGDLREAVGFLFDPSRDPAIQAGAQEVRTVKVNPATQSALTLVDSASDDSVDLTSVDYGLFTTQISVDVANGTNQGKAITIALEDDEEVLDDVGGDTIWTLLFTPGANGPSTMTAELDVSSGVDLAWTRTQAGLSTDYDGSYGSTIPGEDDEKLANIGAGNVVDVVSTSASDTSMSAIVYGIDNGTSLPATETIAVTGTTPAVGSTNWATVHGFILTGVAVGNVTVRDNGGGPTALYTIAAGQTVDGGGMYDFGQLEASEGPVSIALDAAGTPDVIVAGLDHTGTPALEKVALNGTTFQTTTTRWQRVDYLATGYVAAARTVSFTGFILQAGAVLSVQSDAAGDTTQTLTIYGLDGSGDAQTESIALTGTTPAAGTATWSKVLGVALDAVTVGTAIQVTQAGAGTLFDFDGSASLYAGFVLLDNFELEGGTVSLVSDTAGDTWQDVLVVGLNPSNAAQAEKLNLNGTTAVPGSATWGEVTGLAVGHVDTGSTLTLSGTISFPKATYDTVGKVHDQLAANGGWTSTLVAGDARDLTIANMDSTGPTTVVGGALSFYADLYRFIAAINEGSQIVSAARASGADAVPANTASPLYLSGGVEGATSFADWQSAIDLLRDEDINTIVALTGDASVHAAILAHCVYMAGPGAGERDMIVGSTAAATLANAKAAALALNSRHARYVPQSVDRYNSEGVLETFPPYFTACLAAGMQAGSPPGTPLTKRFVNAQDVGTDSSWNVRDDGAAMIEAGVLVIEKVPGRGFRWLRNVTTHLVDDNIAFVEASVNEAANFATREFRRALEIAVGRPGFAGTVNATLAVAVQILGELIASGAITTWRNLTISLSSDVMTVDVEIAPVQPVNFVLSTIHLVNAEFAAAA